MKILENKQDKIVVELTRTEFDLLEIQTNQTVKNNVQMAIINLEKIYHLVKDALVTAVIYNNNAYPSTPAELNFREITINKKKINKEDYNGIGY